MPEKKAFLPLVTAWLNADPELKKLKKNIMQVSIIKNFLVKHYA